MADMKKYLDVTALGALVDQIKSEDAKVLAAAKKYTDDAGKLYDASGSAATAEQNAKSYADTKVAELADGSVAANTAAIAKLNGAATEDGSVAKAVADAKATIDASISAVDAKAVQNASDIAAINNADTGILKQAKDYTDGQVAVVQGAVNDLDTFVGDIPSGYEETNVIAYVNKKAEEVLSAATGGSSESAASVLAALNTYKSTNDAAVAENATAAANAKTAADNAQASADSAQEYAEGVAGDLADEVKARGDADTALDGRITTLEGQITGLTGAMHFKGVVEELPSDVSSYANGDVIVVGEKEYVFNGTAFVEFGDVSAEGERIAALETHKTTYEAKVGTLETKMTAVEIVAAAAATKTALDEVVETLEGADTALSGRIDALESAVGESGSVSEDIADAKQEAIDAAKEDATAKANAAEQNAKNYADGLDDAMKLRVDALEAIDHEHANKALLDSYTQTEENLADAVAKKHEHANADVLAAISAAKVAAWDGAEAAAKAYADGLNTTMNTKVDGAISRIGTLETGIATKAEQEDLSDAIERIAQNETDIAANTSAINSFTPITSDDVNALFA